MLNKKFLTKLLDDEFRNNVLLKNNKIILNPNLKLKQYATYVVDKHMKDRNQLYKTVKSMYYGFTPIDMFAYVSTKNEIKQLVFEFNSINHFLVKNDHKTAVNVAICILSEIVRENKNDVLSFDIDKIDAYVKMIEKTYNEQHQKTEVEDTKNLTKLKTMKESKHEY